MNVINGVWFVDFRLQKSIGMACEKIEEKKKQIEMKKEIE